MPSRATQASGGETPGGGAARPTIGVTMGDPFGIGPEVVVKALADEHRRRTARFVILGCEWAMQSAAAACRATPFWSTAKRGEPIDAAALERGVVLIHDPTPNPETRNPNSPPTATPLGGELSFRFVEDAIASTRAAPNSRGTPIPGVTLDGIVTAPINKEAWALARHAEFPGHTELLAERFGARHTRMMFVAPKLNVMLVTTHIPLAKVPGALSIERILGTIELGAAACRRIGVAAPRVAVCGVNPHAGENGLLGDEDARLIEPAIRAAREKRIDASGPYPGDTIFGAAVAGKYDLVIAMYHDQGLIPVKLLAFNSAVNATIGLPVVRTSPDHGTAFDIAGKGIADPGSMIAAIDLAVRLARR